MLEGLEMIDFEYITAQNLNEEVSLKKLIKTKFKFH